MSEQNELASSADSITVAENTRNTPLATSNAGSQAWMRGFLQIIYRPEQLDALRGANVYKIYLSGTLLNAFAMTISTWFITLSPLLRTQWIQRSNILGHVDGSQVVAQTQSFNFTGALGTAIVQYGLVGFLVMALMMWVLHRVFTNSPLRMLAFVGICAYTASIASMGNLITVGLQYALSSINAGLSLAFTVSAQDHPLISSMLSKFDLFCLWGYLAIGVAAASFMGRKRSLGLLLGVLGFCFHAAFSGSVVYLIFQSALNAPH